MLMTKQSETRKEPRLPRDQKTGRPEDWLETREVKKSRADADPIRTYDGPALGVSDACEVVASHPRPPVIYPMSRVDSHGWGSRAS